MAIPVSAGGGHAAHVAATPWPSKAVVCAVYQVPSLTHLPQWSAKSWPAAHACVMASQLEGSPLQTRRRADPSHHMPAPHSVQPVPLE